jgi:hypothetical protein
MSDERRYLMEIAQNLETLCGRASAAERRA